MCLHLYSHLDDYHVLRLIYDGRLFTPPSSVAIQNSYKHFYIMKQSNMPYELLLTTPRPEV